MAEVTPRIIFRGRRSFVDFGANAGSVKQQQVRVQSGLPAGVGGLLSKRKLGSRQRVQHWQVVIAHGAVTRAAACVGALPA